MNREKRKKNLEHVCVFVCVFIETAFFVSHSRGNVIQISSIDIIYEKKVPD